MSYRGTRWALTAAMIMVGCLTATAADRPAVDKAAIDKAFGSLASYDWGKDGKALQPIDEAVAAAGSDAALRKDVEARLAAVLATSASRDAKDFVCRKLMVIGTAQSVPALAALLADKDLSHMARYALERIPVSEAAQALRDALPKLSGALQTGVIGSLGARRDAASVPALTELLGDSDAKIACAAACALGNIGTPEAGTALGVFAKKATAAAKTAAADACLVCAAHLLADGKKAQAMLLYKSLMTEDQPKHVRLAATHGLLAAAGGH